MNVVTGLAVYFVLWWISLFMVLPWGNRPDTEVQEGNAPSAPAKPRIGLKALVTTGLAAAFWVIIWLVVRSDLIPLRESGQI
jgi:predicted secreted protein